MSLLTAADLDIAIAALGGAEVTVKASPVNALYRRPHTQAGELGLAVETFTPYLICKSSDVTGVVYGDPVIIDSINYKVVNVQHQESGLTHLYIAEA